MVPVFFFPSAPFIPARAASEEINKKRAQAAARIRSFQPSARGSKPVLCEKKKKNRGKIKYLDKPGSSSPHAFHVK